MRHEPPLERILSNGEKGAGSGRSALKPCRSKAAGQSSRADTDRQPNRFLFLTGARSPISRLASCFWSSRCPRARSCMPTRAMTPMPSATMSRATRQGRTFRRKPTSAGRTAARRSSTEIATPSSACSDGSKDFHRIATRYDRSATNFLGPSAAPPLLVVMSQSAARRAAFPSFSLGGAK